MGRERRGEPRYVVEGLHAAIDGAERVILDISPSSVRLHRLAGDVEQPEVALQLWSDPGFPEIDAACRARFIRSSPCELVYGFALATAAWPEALPAFDSFKELHVGELED